MRRERREQEKKKWEKFRKSKFNKWYDWVKGKGVPEYLKKGWKEDRWKRVAKFRLGDGLRGSRYWEKEESRRSRVCDWGKRHGSMCGKNVQVGEGKRMAGDDI